MPEEAFLNTCLCWTTHLPCSKSHITPYTLQLNPSQSISEAESTTLLGTPTYEVIEVGPLHWLLIFWSSLLCYAAMCVVTHPASHHHTSPVYVDHTSVTVLKTITVTISKRWSHKFIIIKNNLTSITFAPKTFTLILKKAIKGGKCSSDGSHIVPLNSHYKSLHQVAVTYG